MKNILYITLVSCIGLTIMISCSEKEESSSSSSSFTEDIKFLSSASDNATVVFGQTYQHQVTKDGSYSGTVTYSLDNEPDNMTISSTGLIEWTPTTELDINNNQPYTITIKIKTASGYEITQTYDLTVTGTYVCGNVLSIWSGDQRSSTDSSKLLGNVTAYTDNASDNCGPNNNLDCTAENNYQFNQPITSSENLNIGPETSAEDGIMFFYNQYDNTTHTYLFWMFGKGGAAFSNPNYNDVDFDIFIANNESPDDVEVSDETGETSRESQTSSSPYSSTYTGRYHYSSGKSDGAVIGPFSGSSYRIFIDLGGTSTINSNPLSLGNLDSFMYWSKDNSSFALGAVDNFTIGYSTSIECSN